MIYDELWTLKQYIIDRIIERTNNNFGEQGDYLEKSENIKQYVDNSVSNAVHDCNNAIKSDCIDNTCGLMSCKDKKKLDSLYQTPIDSALSSTSKNPLQNKAIYSLIESLKKQINSLALDGTLRKAITTSDFGSNNFNSYTTRGLYQFYNGNAYTHSPIGSSSSVSGNLIVYVINTVKVQQEFLRSNGYRYTRYGTKNDNGVYEWDNWYLTFMPTRKIDMTLASGCTGFFGYEGTYGYQFFWEQKLWRPSSTLYSWKKLASFSIDVNGFNINNDGDMTGFIVGDHIGNSDILVQNNGAWCRSGTTIKVVDWNFSWFVPRKDFGKQPY